MQSRWTLKEEGLGPFPKKGMKQNIEVPSPSLRCNPANQQPISYECIIPKS